MLKITIVAQTKQNNPAIATVVNFGVSFLHLSVTEKTEKPIEDVSPKTNPNKEFFERYQNNKTITIHQTYANSISGADPIVFASGQAGLIFDVFANKRRVPMKFDPGFTNASASTGKWYIQCKDEHTSSDNIFWRIAKSDYQDRQRSTDMWYQRLEDDRDKDDRTYKLRIDRKSTRLNSSHQ